MTESCPKDDTLLMKSEEWNPASRKRSKLEEVRNTIFHLRHNKEFSYTAIKHFLEESGIRTSTAALSNFCRSRFTKEALERTKTAVLSRLADLKREDAESAKPSNT